MILSKDKAVEFIYSSYMRATKYLPKDQTDRETRSPELTRQLLDRLGKPDQLQKNILVTGSKGKGSVSRILAKLLQDHGYNVGLFTSPHLVDFNERIRINGIAISDEDLIRYVNYIYPYVLEIEKGLDKNKYMGPVGITSVIASLYFKDRDTDFNVIECGRGSRYDDVSMLNSQWAIINKVFLEHIPEVGRNIEEIAYNKAGIIKGTQKAVYISEQMMEVKKIIEEEAQGLGVPLKIYGDDYYSSNIKITPKGTVFDMVLNGEEHIDMETNLLGRYQAYNITLAVGLLKEILGNKMDINKVRKALKEITWPGRLEIIYKNPLTILDGCINKECAKYVKEIINEINIKPIVTILGIPDNKDFEGVFWELNSVSDKMIITHASNKHLNFTNKQYEIIKNNKGDCIYIKKPEEAISEAKRLVGNDGLICIVGTQSLIRDVKILYKQSTRDL